MKEAVEIAKLRLFLKLVATVEADYRKPNLGLEPLPDIDFNIRAGNTIVGFATAEELNKAFIGVIDFDNDKGKIEEKCDIVALTFARYKKIQLGSGEDYFEFKKDKAELQKRLKELNYELNKLLHKQASDIPFDKWLHTHQPFHWFAEFYEIIHDKGGFDVIIGNPPYTQVPQNLSRECLKKFDTALDVWSRDENLYTMILEQCFTIINCNALIGMIIPLSITFSTKRPFNILRSTLQKKKIKNWWLHFDRIPSGLFGNEVRTRCSILIIKSTVSTNENYTTALKRWESEFRDYLFDTTIFSNLNIDYSKNFPKVSSQIQANSLSRLLGSKMVLDIDLKNSIPFSKLKFLAPNFPLKSVYIGGTAYNWFPAWREIPETFDEKRKASLPARTAGFLFSQESDANIVFALLCSSLGYWWWAVASDGFNLKKWLLSSFPISLSHLSVRAKTELSDLGMRLNIELKKNYVYKENKGKIGNYFLPACSKEIKEIDDCLAKHIEGLSKDFFDDIRSFNNYFSRAVIHLEDLEEEEEE